MPKRRTELWLTAVVLGIGAIVAFVAGLWAYMSATATPLHPNANAITSVTHAAVPSKWAAAVERGRQIARAGLADQNLPGLSVAVGVDGDLVWSEGFGWADIERRVPVSPEMRFRTGGVSIPITAAAVGLLVEKHALDLDAEIQTYVPAFPKKRWPVTLGELMGHTAGIRKDGGDEEPLGERCDRTADGLRRFAKDDLLFEPGTKYRYSAYGWIVVSAAVEAAAGEPFFTFVRTHVLEPLGMNDTAPDSSDAPNRPAFYYPRFAADTRYGPDPVRSGDYSCFAGAGGFLSTPTDLVRFAVAIDAGQLLQPATVAMLQAPQRIASGRETGYGLGWDLETLSLGGQPSPMVGHDDEYTIGGSASLETFPDRRIVIAVMTNISFANTASIATDIAQTFVASAR